jgi:hypothetical protein
MESKLWYHRSKSLTSVISDIINLWYHKQYHTDSYFKVQIIYDIIELELGYHSSETMISSSRFGGYSRRNAFSLNQLIYNKYMDFGIMVAINYMRFLLFE